MPGVQHATLARGGPALRKTLLHLLAALLIASLVACDDGDGDGDADTDVDGDSDSDGDGDGDADSDADDDEDGEVDGDADPRQELRDRSLFDNVSFEENDSVPRPRQWSCLCFGAAEGTDPPCWSEQAGARHGEWALVLPPGCAAFQDEETFDDTRTVDFSLFGRGDDVSATDFYIFAFDEAEVATQVIADELTEGEDGWGLVTAPSLSTRDQVSLRMVLYNAGTTELRVDDLVAVQDEENPPPSVGALLFADHYTELAYGAEGEAGELWLPLPLDWATQVPLYVELTVTPDFIVDEVEYVEHAEENWGAIVRLAELGEADPVVIAWQGVVLTRGVDDEERPTFYEASSDPGQWLVATPVADAAYAGIAETASSLAESSDPALDRMLAVIGWTSANLGADDVPTALDATTVYETHDASCTGFANLASALGRALEVPTRAVANYMVGMSQQTHSVSEFYLGEALGWRRVEPQGTAALVPEPYALTVRLVLPSDEAAEANEPTWRWAMPGVPLYTLVEPLAGHGRMAPDWTTDHFPDCAQCDNRAEVQAHLVDSPTAPMDEVFDRARALWQIDRAAYLSGGLDPGRMTVRRGALEATSLDDVDALLGQLE